MAAINTFKQTQWRNRYTWSRGASRSMIDFFLCSEYMLRWQHTAKGGSLSWNMQSDHRAIRLTLPHVTNIRDKKDGPHLRKGNWPSRAIFGNLAEAAIKANPPNTIARLDEMFSEVAKNMPKATPRKKPLQDPRIKRLISERKKSFLEARMAGRDSGLRRKLGN